MNSNIQIKSIDLKEDIDYLVTSLGATRVYLFGSRRFKTGSTRSDVDIIIETNKVITMVDFQEYYENHKYLDLFIKKGDIVESIVTGAFIKKGFFDFSFLKPIVLWNKKYMNESFYKQEVFAFQSFYPSSQSYGGNFLKLKSIINRINPSNEIQIYFQEAFANYANNSYISCVSMIGCACELIVNELINSCEKKHNLDHPGDSYFVTNIKNKRNAKDRLSGIESYCVQEKNFLKQHGITKIEEHFKMFDLIRNYRNNADHPLGFDFSKEDCEIEFGGLRVHIEEIFKIINLMNSLH